MAGYLDEDEVWKCPKHPSKRRKSGICPTCLRERLVTLCPECANLRPCTCCASLTAATATATSSSSSSSSSFSLFPSRWGSRREPAANSAAAGEVGSVASLIDSEPAFRRSRSLAIPFLRSRSRFVGASEFDRSNDKNKPPLLPPVSRSKISFWSVFKLKIKSDKSDSESSDDSGESSTKCKEFAVAPDDYSSMRRSRSVAIGVGAARAPAAKGKGWYFPSPIKAFRGSNKSAKVVQERSPLHRG